MKTITNCFMWMTIEILWATLNMFSAISAYFHQSWWIMAFNIAVMILCTVCAVASYRRAKDYEMTILGSINDLMMFNSIRDFKEYLESKYKNDEMARNN